MKPEIAPEFMELFLLTSASLAAINGMKTGSSESGLNLTHQRFRQLAVVIPPLAEQHRIVAKVDELIALCDELEAAQTEREARRDRLRATSLRNFVAPHESKEHARFFLQHSPRMITKPEHVAGVRRAILDLAVRGRLVPQNLGGPSSQYSENDSAHVTSNAQTQDSFPFEVAATTTWSTLGDVIAFGPQNGISPRVSSRPEAPRAITLTATTSGRFDERYFKHVDFSATPESEYWLRPGDLLFQRGNTKEYVGMAALYDGAPGQFLYPDLIIKVRIQPEHSSRYVHLCAIAPYARHYLSSNAAGAQKTMPKINHSTLRQLPLPLPPLEEQHRIVAKVDELMAVCNELEQSLSTEQSERGRLLEALLHDALQDGLPGATSRAS